VNPTNVFATGALAGILIGYIAGRFVASGAQNKSRKSNGRKGNQGGRGNQDSSKPVRGGKFATTRTGKGVELYVGNLAYGIREKDMAQAFGKSGKVLSARVICNKFNGKSKGYGFIEMADKAGAKKAVEQMNASDLRGRKLVVNEARSKSRDDD
jgi:RNA recognition motif-containing protein